MNANRRECLSSFISVYSRLFAVPLQKESKRKKEIKFMIKMRKKLRVRLHFASYCLALFYDTFGALAISIRWPRDDDQAMIFSSTGVSFGTWETS